MSSLACSASTGLIIKKEKETEEQFTKRMAERERGKINSDNSFCQELLTAAVWQQEINISIYLHSRGCLGARFWSSKYILMAVQENTSSRSKIANPRELAEAVFTFYRLCGSLSKGSQVGGYKQVCVTSWFSGLLLHSQSVWECCLFKNKL